MTQDLFKYIRNKYERLAEENPKKYVRVFLNQKSGAGTSFCLNSDSTKIDYGCGDWCISIYEQNIPSYYFVEVENIESISITFIDKPY